MIDPEGRYLSILPGGAILMEGLSGGSLELLAPIGASIVRGWGICKLIPNLRSL